MQRGGSKKEVLGLFSAAATGWTTSRLPKTSKQTETININFFILFMLPLYPKAPDAIPVYIGAQHRDVKISRLRRFFREGKRSLPRMSTSPESFQLQQDNCQGEHRKSFMQV